MTVDASAVPAETGGVGRYVAGLLGGLSRRDDVDVVVVAGAGDRQRWLDAADGRFGVTDVAPRSVPARLAWEQARLPGVLRRFGPAVHHGTHYTFPRRAASVPKVVTIHDLTFVEHPEWHARTKVAFFRNAIAAAARHAEVVVCVSRTTAERLEGRFRVEGRVVVAPHGVDGERFRPADPGDGADGDRLAALGITGPYVLFVGTIEPRKDVPTLVRAFDRVAVSVPDVSLVIAGSPGWGDAPVAEAIGSARHGDRVRRLGFVAEGDVPVLLRSAAAVVYPSLEEGFGLPALEALACGAPTITTRGTAMEEFAGEAAVLFDPGDVAGLADLIQATVSGDPSLRLAERRSAGFSVAAGHTWDASAERHVEAYRAAAGQ